MSQVYASVRLDISVPVATKSMDLALLEANYKFNNDRMLVYQLHIIEPCGKLSIIDIHNSDIVLDTYIE